MNARADRKTRVKTEPDTPEETTEETTQPTQAAQNFSISAEKAPENSIPEPEEKKPSLADTVLTRIGIKQDKNAPEVKPLPGGKLNKSQEEFVETVSPLGASILIMVMGWIWAQVDADYRVLAPSQPSATAMVTPLLRIYARHNKTLIKASPDAVDWIMFINAFVLYAHSSLMMLSEINRMKREMQNDTNGNYEPRPQENAPNDASAGRSHLSVTPNENVGSNGGRSSAPDHLSERDRQQYESLALLRDRDMQSRARRSGR